jgi:Tfp pilus assembly protein PilN
MLAAGANSATLLSTMRRYVIVHSKSDADVLDMLRELQQANTVAFAAGLQSLTAKQRDRVAEVERLTADIAKHAWRAAHTTQSLRQKRIRPCALLLRSTR